MGEGLRKGFVIELDGLLDQPKGLASGVRVGCVTGAMSV